MGQRAKHELESAVDRFLKPLVLSAFSIDAKEVTIDLCSFSVPITKKTVAIMPPP